MANYYKRKKREITEQDLEKAENIMEKYNKFEYEIIDMYDMVMLHDLHIQCKEICRDLEGRLSYKNKYEDLINIITSYVSRRNNMIHLSYEGVDEVFNDMEKSFILQMLAHNKVNYKVREICEKYIHEKVVETKEILKSEAVDIIHLTIEELSSENITNKIFLEELDRLRDEEINNIMKKDNNMYIDKTLPYIEDYFELNKLALLNGFDMIRQRGDHAHFKNKDGMIVTIPQCRSIGRGLSKVIQRQILKPSNYKNTIA